MRWCLVLSAALAACYSPRVRDCTVSCAGAAECESGQVCGADGFCAAPDIAGHCALVDAQPGPSHDAPSPPQDVTLHVIIMGEGQVTVSGTGVCAGKPEGPGDCTWQVPANVARIAAASEGFQKWTSSTCTGQSATCSFTPSAATELAAKFK